MSSVQKHYKDVKFNTEGGAKFFSKEITEENGKIVEKEAFYNPVQEFNRDLSTLMIQMHINYLKKRRKEKFQGVNILDALSASGLRTIRFLKELDNNDINKVYANDIAPSAHQIMSANFELNELNKDKIEQTMQDALYLMKDLQQKQVTIDVVDLDPYGTVIPFLDQAIQSAQHDTMLMITCTDSRILMGSELAKCYSLYNSQRLKQFLPFQEHSIRIVMNNIATSAARYGKYFVPLISYQREFYLRVYIRIQTDSKLKVSENCTKQGMVFYCQHCQNQVIQPFGRSKETTKQKSREFGISKMNPGITSVCSQCGGDMAMIGPTWLGELNTPEYIEEVLEYLKSDENKLKLNREKFIKDMLRGIIQEHKAVGNYPYGHSLTRLCSFIKATQFSYSQFSSACESLGAKCVQSYCNQNIIKTSLSTQQLYDIFRRWKQIQDEKKPTKEQKDKEPSTKRAEKKLEIQENVKNLLSKEVETLEIDFERKVNIQKVRQFHPNPEENWGPKKMAVKENIIQDQEDEEPKKETA